MKQFVVLIAILCTGCSLTVPPVNPDTKPDTPVVVNERAPAAEVFLSLAHAVEVKQITTTTELARTVLALAKNGDLTADDAAKFDSAFPGATTKERALTADDGKTLRGIK